MNKAKSKYIIEYVTAIGIYITGFLGFVFFFVAIGEGSKEGIISFILWLTIPVGLFIACGIMIMINNKPAYFIKETEDE